MTLKATQTRVYALVLSVLLLGSRFAMGAEAPETASQVERPRIVLGDPNTCKGKVINSLAKLLYPPLGVTRLEKAYKNAMADKSSPEFFGKFLKQQNISVVTKEADLKNIPKEGKLIILSNHPNGLNDISAVISKVSPERSDIKVIMNDVVQLPGVKDQVISVSIMGSQKENAKNGMAAMKEAMRWVNDGHVLLIAGSGEVAHATEKGSLKAVEAPWKASLTALAEKTDAPIVPVFIHGQNSALFQKSGQVPKIGDKLRLVQIPRENASMAGSTIKLEIGAPIKADEYAGFPDKESKAQYLRAKTLAMENREPKAHAVRDQSKFEKIHPGPSTEQLAKAIEAIEKIPGAFLTERGDAQAFIVSREDYEKFAKSADPRGFDQILDEIGRLREITFREAGEGTGKARDLDQYDEYYLHEIIWDKKKGKIAGLNRLGLTDKILAKYGPKGLYTSTQIKYGDDFLKLLGPAIEPGRTCVPKEYQGSLSGLPLLFQGIATFMGKNPQYRKLLGSVSMSKDYNDLSIQLTINHLMQHHFDPELAKLVSAKNPPVLHPGLTPADIKLLNAPIHDFKQLGKLISQIEPDGKGPPMLLRRYTDWNAKILTFDFDKDFNTVDGFMVADLYEAGKLDRKQLNNTMGKELADQFMKYHENH